jgi:hypothetical protein
MTLGRVLAATAAALTFVILSQTAAAQYPPPEGSLICQVAQLRVEQNSNVYFQVRMIDGYGNPKPNTQVFFGITSNGNATLSPTSGITDMAGLTGTNVYVGTATHVEVSATAQGKSCRSLFDPNTPTPTPTPTRSATPTIVRTPTPVVQVQGVVAGSAVASSVITPPQTGDAGLLGASHSGTTLYILVVVELAALMAWLLAGRLPVTRSK